MTGPIIRLNVNNIMSYRILYKWLIYDKTISIFLFHILDSTAFRN